MTEAGQPAQGHLSSESLEEAESELAQVREALESAARGETSGAELKVTLESYLDDHGPALKAAAAAVGEETRRQTLEQLYQWRAQLEDQRKARESAAQGGAPDVGHAGEEPATEA
jgi:hypothetical protein